MWIRTATACGALIAAVLVAPTGSASAATEGVRLPIADCKPTVGVADQEIQIGFSPLSGRLPTRGPVNVTAIFVDFPDEPAGLRTQAHFNSFIPSGLNILERFSLGALTFNVDGPHGWFRMPKAASAYPYRRGNLPVELLEDAVRLADPTVDFSQTDALIVVMPPSMKNPGYEWSPAFLGGSGWDLQADGNRLNNGTTIGTDWSTKRDYLLAHELLHTMGLVDLYKYETTLPDQSDVQEFVGAYSLMSSYDAPTPDIFAWERWVLGWLKDSQSACLGTGTHVLDLHATHAATDQPKIAVFPLGGTRYLAMEARVRTGPDTESREGVLPYIVDPTISTGEGPVIIPRASSGGLLDPLPVGKTLVVEGVGIEVRARTANTFSIVVHSPAPAPTLPGVVAGVRILPSLGMALLAWDEPANTGWTSITGYQYRIGKGPWIQTSTPGVTLKGAKRGQRITVQVRAINSVGAGPITRITTRVT